MHAGGSPVDAAGGREPDHVVRSVVNGRDNNEDSVLVFPLAQGADAPPLTVLAVADGMGGHGHGEHASSQGLRKLGAVLFESVVLDPSLNNLETPRAMAVAGLCAVLLNALEQANAHICRMTEVNRWGKAGSTIVVALVMGDRVVVGNLGDSPLLHYEAATRRLVKVTDDHTVAGVLLRAGLISPEMARHHEGRSRLEFYLGSSELPREAPVRDIAVSPGDLLLLASDGVTGPLLLEDILPAVVDHLTDLPALAETLFKAAREAGETDNQTLIIWRCPGTSGRCDEPPTAQTRVVQGPVMAPAVWTPGAGDAPADAATTVTVRRRPRHWWRHKPTVPGEGG